MEKAPSTLILYVNLKGRMIVQKLDRCQYFGEKSISESDSVQL